MRTASSLAVVACFAVGASLVACFVTIDESKIRSVDGGSSGGDGGRLDGAITSDADVLPDVNLDDASPSVDADIDAAAQDPDLLGLWTFDNPADLGHDSSPNGNHGTFTGAPSQATGVSGGALALSGTQFMDVPALANTAFPQSQGTVSMWVVWTDSGSMDLLDLDDAPSLSRGHLGMSMSTGGSADLRVQCVNSGGIKPCNDHVTLLVQAWYQIVVTWTPTGHDVYVGSAALPKSQLSATDKPWRIAAFTPSQQLMRIGNGLVGRVDDLRLYRRAFSASELGKLR